MANQLRKKYYSNALLKLHCAQVRGRKILAKPIFFLSVIQAIEDRVVSDNKFEYGNGNFNLFHEIYKEMYLSMYLSTLGINTLKNARSISIISSSLMANDGQSIAFRFLIWHIQCLFTLLLL